VCWSLPPRNDRGRGFALANRAFADTAGKAESKHQRADHHNEFLHEAPHQLNLNNDYRGSGSPTSAEKPQRRIFDYISKVNELASANACERRL
jgi:hypothetical protein